MKIVNANDSSTTSTTNNTSKEAPNGYTHLAVVVDRSGSMHTIAKDMVGGFESFLAEQKKVPGKATITLNTFDDVFETIHDFVDLDTVSTVSINPRGSTALLDAMGKTMTSVKEKIEKMDERERPSKCVVIFITDGFENASKEYNKAKIFEMIEEFKKDTNVIWDFTFIGANQDAIETGADFGIRAGATLSYCANAQGSRYMFDSLSNYTTQSRSSKCCASFSQEDRDKQGV